MTKIYYWAVIRKLRPGFHAVRGIREQDVCRILQDEVVLKKDPVTATQKLLDLPGLKKYQQSLKTKDEKEHFQRHLGKYVRIYMPDCAFEVCTTNRYTITTHEAAVVARKDIKKGEVIKYLTGIQVAMTKKEEEELDLKNRDFSIVMSSRKKTPSLFLGPARFANHDCNANAKLSTTGHHGMQIVSTRNIDLGEEITVTYGDDYLARTTANVYASRVSRCAGTAGPAGVKAAARSMIELPSPSRPCRYSSQFQLPLRHLTPTPCGGRENTCSTPAPIHQYQCL